MLKSYVWVGGWVAHRILVSAPVPLELILTGFDWVEAWAFGVWVFGRGLTIPYLFILGPFIHRVGL